MFNSYSNSNNTISVNAVTGTLVKNYRNSFFYRFHLQSAVAKTILNYERPNIDNKPVVVIQSMVCGDMEVMCEIMWKDDFDKLFEEAQV